MFRGDTWFSALSHSLGYGNVLCGCDRLDSRRYNYNIYMLQDMQMDSSTND